MRSSSAYISLAVVHLFASAVLFAGEPCSEPERKLVAAWIGQKERGQLVRLLKDFHRVCADHEADTVAAATQMLERAEGTMGLDEATTRRFTAWLKACRAQNTFVERDVTLLLAQLGDYKEIGRAIEKLHSGSPLDQLHIPGGLSQSKQPLVIQALAKDLFGDESLGPKLIASEFLVYPPSVVATDIIWSILRESPAFSAEVRNWAEGLPKLKTEKQRELLRLWWEENKQFFDTLHYHRVVPLSPEKYTLTPEDYKPKRSPIRRIQ
jgi:hypothetical protein